MTPEKETPNPKTVDEVVEEFYQKFTDEYAPILDTPSWNHMGVTPYLVESWLRTTLQAQNQAADERLRGVVREILARAVWQSYDKTEKDMVDMIQASDVKTIAAKHGITNL